MEDHPQITPFSAVWFGDYRNSTGTIPTDKKFTGQRLDQTGLYYYGARYYDATIGRFISADTVMPNFSNPQVLNRYSYCRNNPLKYIDPNGHDVYTDDENVKNIDYDIMMYAKYGIFPDNKTISAINSQIFQGYNRLRTVESKVCSDMENSNVNFYFHWGDTDAIADTFPRFSSNNIDWANIDVTLNKAALINEGPNGIACVMAHESVHCTKFMNDQSLFDSCYEEAIALRYQYQVAQKLGYVPHTHGLWQRLFSNPVGRSWKYVTKSLDVDLSLTPGGNELFNQLDSVFRGGTYAALGAFPRAEYYSTLVNIINTFLNIQVID